jgi:hypothetical protein
MPYCFLLKSIRSEWPTGILPFLLFWGLYLWNLWSVSPSSLWLTSHSDYSPTAPAPSLRPLIPSSSFIGCQSAQVYYHQPPFLHHDTQQDANNKSFFQLVWANYLQWPVLLHLWLLPCVQSLLSFRNGPSPPQCPDIHFPNPNWRFNSSLQDLQHISLPEDPAECPLTS